MPMDKSRYPLDWKKISHHIRFVRAGGKCEQCGVKHGAVGARDKNGEWWDKEDIDNLNADMGDYYFDGFYPKMTKIVLTVHHLGIPKANGEVGSTHDKMDCRPENLISLCQKHHLEADMPIHIANRKVTLAKKRAEKIEAAGQQSLFK
jgi:hypothetical protein